MGLDDLQNLEAQLSRDDEGRLCFKFPEESQLKPLVVDFVAGEMGFKLRRGGFGRNHLLARAVGIKDRPQFVLDATAGFCNDSLLLRYLGLRVLALEKNPIVFSLVEDALLRAQRTEHFMPHLFTHNFQFCNQDALEVMAEWKGVPPEVVYLDPMFPPRQKSSLVKKKMQVLQALLGEDQQETEKLIGLAMGLASQRVVVKRPKNSNPLQENPTFQFVGKSIRYDMYLTR
jgi:16S rRNA (guanine1516-N2)-methyltransferase